MPILKSGGYEITKGSEPINGPSVTLSAANLDGYELSHYSVEGRPDGRVRLRFVSAELAKDGQTTQEPSEPKLPFRLPRKNQHVRLLYLVRQSQSDHNMAILAAKDLQALNDFTKRVKGDASFCKLDGEVSCQWIPAGIAVRAE